MSTSSGGILRYPYEAITEKTDFLQLSIFKYDTTNAGGGDTLINSNFQNQNPYSSLAIGSQVTKNKVLIDDGIIALPMPSNIQDTNSVSYEAGELNKFSSIALEAVAGRDGLIDNTNIFSPKAGEQFTKVMKNISGDIGDVAPDAIDMIKKSLAVQAVNVFGANVSVNSLLARSGGKVLNPNMELLFNNVTLRTFRFSFKMTPRDENEATSIKSIIRSLKRNMAARNRGGIFLETPNIFELQYKKGNRPHPFLNLFKPAVLSDMSVNYTGENVYATYADGTPVSMIMTLTFKELLPVYEEDYVNRANFNGESNGTVTDNDLIYNSTSTNVQGVGF